ncbi:MAG TPA: hypothetical protein PLG43_01015, partial [Spirochaetia bacterium]|nr:hypothetical protein [Spirochaetia bacterium]
QRLSCLKIDFSPLLADIRKAEDRFLASCTTGFTTDIFGRVIARDPQSVEAEVKVFTECLEESASSVLEAWDAESSAFLAEVSDEYLAQGLPFERLSLPLSTIRAGVKRECERLISQSARGLLSLGISGASSDGGVFPSQVSSVQNEYPAIAGTDKFLFESPADILSATDPLCDDFSERFEEGMTAWNDAYLEFLKQRSAWEEGMVQSYEADESSWGSMLSGLEASRDAWRSDIEQQFSQGEDGFKSEFEELARAYQEAQENLQPLIRTSEESFVRDLSLISSSFSQGTRMLQEAERMIAIGDDDAYWFEVMDAGEAMRQKALSMAEGMEDSFFADSWTSDVEEELDRLSSIIDRTQDTGSSTFYAAQALYTLFSSLPQASVSLIGDPEYQRLKAAEKTIMEKASVLCELGRGYDLLCNERAKECTRLKNSIRSAFSALFTVDPLLAFETGDGRTWEELPISAEAFSPGNPGCAADLKLWTDELVAEGENLPDLLEDLGLASFYERNREGYNDEISLVIQNQYIATLAGKLGIDTEAFLMDTCEQTFAELSADPRKQRLCEYYGKLLAEGILNERDMHETFVRQDIVASVVSYLTDEAKPEIARHREEGRAFAITAGINAALSTAALCSLNFVGAAIFGGLASAALAKSIDEKSKAEDLQTLCDNMPLHVSGKDERLEIAARIMGLEASQQSYEEALVSLAGLTRDPGDEALSVDDLAALSEELGLEFPEAWISPLFSSLSPEERCSYSKTLNALTSCIEAERSNLEMSLEQWIDTKLTSFESLSAEASGVLFHGGDIHSFIPIASTMFSSSEAVSQNEFFVSELLWANDQREQADTLSLEADYFETEMKNLARLYSYSLSSSLRENAYHAELEYELLYDKEKDWDTHVRTAITEGAERWDDCIANAYAKRDDCRRVFFAQYEEQAASFSGDLNEFLSAMEQWIAENLAAGTASGLSAAVSPFATDPKVMAAVNSFTLSSNPSFRVPDLLSDIQEEMDSYLSEIRNRVREANGQGYGGQANFRRELNLPAFRSTHTQDVMACTLKAERDIALLSASYAREGFAEAYQNLSDGVRMANLQVERQVDAVLTERGYRRSSNLYQRKALVDVSLLQYENAVQRIEAYHHFLVPPFKVPDSLDTSLFAAETGSEVYGAIEDAFAALADFRDLIFGCGEDGFSASDGEQGLPEDIGLFGIHVGSAPAFRNGSPSGGSGEYGRIFGALYTQEESLGRGLSMLGLPSYRRRLWDDDVDNDGKGDSFFKAPDLASVYDIALGIAVNTLVGPGLGSILLNVADDALFGCADVSGGYATADELLFSLGKKVVSGAASYGSGALFNAAAAQVPFEGLGGIAIRTALKGTQTGIDLVTQSALASLQYSSEGGFTFDPELYTDTILSSDSVAALASGLCREAVTGSAGLLTLRNTSGFSYETLADLEGLNETAGIVVAAGIDYAMKGDVVLSLAGVGGTGVVELSFGNEGLSAGFGRGGWVMRPRNIATSVRGTSAAVTNGRIGRFGRDFAEFNGLDPASILRAQYSYGDTSAVQALKNILSGRDSLAIASDDSLGYTALSDTGGRVMHIASWDGSDDDLVRSALALQHEAHRDGIAGEENDSETAEAVVAHTLMGVRIYADGRYSDSLSDDLLAFDTAALFSGSDALLKYVAEAYDSSGDYWKLKKNGTIVWDGKFDLYDDGGNRVLDGAKGSYSNSLGMFIGKGTNAKGGNAEVVRLLEENGILWSKSGGYYLDPGLQKQFPEMDISSIEFAASDSVIRAAMNPRDAYAVLVQRGKLMSDAYTLLSHYGTEPETLGFDRFVSFEEFVSTNYPFTKQGTISRTLIPKYDQKALARAVLGKQYTNQAGNQYCNIDVLALEIMRKTGKSFTDVAKAISSVDAKYFNQKSGYINNYQKVGEQILEELGVNDWDLKLVLFHEDSEKVLSAMRNDVGGEYFIGGYYQRGESGHWVHIDNYGTLSNPYPHETIWSNDWDLSYMNLFSWVKK